jgi:hypothetical protein
VMVTARPPCSDATWHGPASTRCRGCPTQEHRQSGLASTLPPSGHGCPRTHRLAAPEPRAPRPDASATKQSSVVRDSGARRSSAREPSGETRGLPGTGRPRPASRPARRPSSSPWQSSASTHSVRPAILSTRWHSGSARAGGWESGPTQQTVQLPLPSVWLE